MVYFGGKPSTGCERCRIRKIKCDQKAGGCANCEKRGYECSGYRNEVDLRFRDESRQVAKKSQDREASRRKASLSRSPLPGSSTALTGPSRRPSEVSEFTHSGKDSASMVKGTATGVELAVIDEDEFFPDPALSEILSPDLDDQASAFFFSNHVLGEWHAPYGENVRSYGMDDALFSTVKTIGLAGISGFSHTSELNIEARKRYLAAIQSVNNAIVFPESAKRDSTLTSIMLLSQIEAIECFTPRSLDAWENHVKGAAAIIKLRGVEKLKAPLEIRLFIQAVSSLIVCCMKTRIHLPEHLFELMDVAGQGMKIDAPGMALLSIANAYHSVCG
ncbi:hypothetical protein EG329_012536 [Mollisiaceae sp. DMI_Dod_QoI]|nr:hypothetical protein EG329_012536 [Helotiales sp. DMI_Dod_QoI]